jgi:hypothetical protein
MSSDCQTRQLDKYSPNAHPRECNIESSYWWNWYWQDQGEE